MPGTLIAEPLFAKPFLNLKERMTPGDPGTPLKINPKLAATPKKLKAARSMTKLVMQTDIKIEELPAIGNPTENVPTDGLRLIHWNDRWILFGNSGSNPPRLYERTGPVYTRTEAYPSGDWPTNTSFSFAAFSKAGRFMYAVKSNDLQNVQVYQWSGATEDSLDGEWQLKTPLAIGANVTGLEISPLNNFLIVRTATFQTRLFDIQNVNAPVAPASLPVGEAIAVQSDELEWVFSLNGSTVNVYTFNLGTRVFTLSVALAGSAGTLRTATYSPDNLVLSLNGRPTSGSAMPRHYARRNGLWYLVSTGTHAGAGTWEHTKLSYKADSSQAFFTHNEGGQKAEFLTRTIATPDVFVDAAGNPYPAGGAPLTGARPVRSGNGLRVATATGAWVYNPGTQTYTAVTPAGFATPIGLDMSRDGNWMIKCTTTAITLWAWNGTAWATATAPASPAGTLRGVSLSKDGQFCALVYNQLTTNTGLCRIFQRNVSTGAWTQVGADIAMGNTDATGLLKTTPVWHPTRNDILVFQGHLAAATLAQRFYRLVSGTWTESVGALPFPAGYTNKYFGAYWTSNGAFLVTMSGSAAFGNWSLNVFAFNSAANTFSLFQSLLFTTGATGGPQHWQMSVEEKMIAMASTGTPVLRLFGNTGTLVAPVWGTYANPASTAATTTTGVLWTPDFLATFSNAAASPNYWAYSQFATYPTYAFSYSFSGPAGTTLPPNDGYNDSETIANFGGSAWAQHPYVNVPFTPSPSYPPSLGFAPQYAITAIWAYYLSSSKKVVLYQTANGIGIATRPNTASSYLNTETLRACFVDLYDRVGNEFQLRSYSIHLIDTIVKDFQFSPNEEVLAYHTIAPAGAPGDTIQGRMVYDISLTKFEFRGNVWTAEMTNSLMAFSPFSTEMVVTHERLVTGNPVITLHEFGTNYVFGTQDTKPVLFGPPDFSACNDVVVAHGGSPPMSFFIHDDPGNVLTPNPVTIDWEYTGLILAIAFRADCKGVVAITPTVIVTIEEPEEDEWEVDEEEDLDEPIEPPTLPDHEWPDVVWEPDEIEVIRDPLTNPNYPGTYDPNTLTNISYVPYTVVSVTFRVASVAQ